MAGIYLIDFVLRALLKTFLKVNSCLRWSDFFLCVHLSLNKRHFDDPI